MTKLYYFTRMKKKTFCGILFQDTPLSLIKSTGLCIGNDMNAEGRQCLKNGARCLENCINPPPPEKVSGSAHVNAYLCSSRIKDYVHVYMYIKRFPYPVTSVMVFSCSACSIKKTPKKPKTKKNLKNKNGDYTGIIKCGFG